MSKTQIIQAVQALDFARTRRLLDSKPSLLAVTDRKGRNLLHLACAVPCGDLRIPESAATRMAGLLLQAGIDLESTKGDPGMTALHCGLAKGYDPALLAWLVKHGAASDIPDRRGVTARQLAARKRDTKWLASIQPMG